MQRRIKNEVGGNKKNGGAAGEGGAHSCPQGCASHRARLGQYSSVLRRCLIWLRGLGSLTEVEWGGGGINSVGVISKSWLPTLPRTRGSFYSLFARVKTKLLCLNSKQSTIWPPPHPPTASPPLAAGPQHLCTILGTRRLVHCYLSLCIPTLTYAAPFLLPPPLQQT